MPDGAASDDGAELVELFRFDEPEVGLGLAGGADVAFDAAVGVEEFAGGGVVAAEDDVFVPFGEVADDFEVV